MPPIQEGKSPLLSPAAHDKGNDRERLVPVTGVGGLHSLNLPPKTVNLLPVASYQRKGAGEGASAELILVLRPQLGEHLLAGHWRTGPQQQSRV